MAGFRRPSMLSWFLRRPPESHDLHGRVALGALEYRPGSRCTGFNQDLQNHLNQRQQLFGIAMQEAVISDPAKAFERQARKRLMVLHATPSIEALMLNPGNKFHALSGNRKGQYAISINRQWRVCFEWNDGNAYYVEITDYH